MTCIVVSIADRLPSKKVYELYHNNKGVEIFITDITPG